MDSARPLPQTALTPARDRALAFALLALWAAVTTWRQWGHWAEDLSAVYIAGWLWQTGQAALVYDAPPAFFGGVAESWRPAMEAMGIAGRHSFPFVYPPLWAVLVAPLTTILDAQGFMDAVALVQIPLLAASVWLAGRLLKPAAMPWWAWTSAGLVTLSLSIQSHLAIWHNQPTITVGFLTLLSIERLGAGRPVAAGVALALAAAIKLTPAAVILIFLLDRQWRAAA
jgi:alpha-1,2-mannosyltransferase